MSKRERERERKRGALPPPEITIFRGGLDYLSKGEIFYLFLFCIFTGQLNPKFPYSEADYLSKCDLIATAINQWNQAPYVREFFAEPPRAYRGLPRYINSQVKHGATK